MTRKRLFGASTIVIILGLVLTYWQGYRHAYPYGSQPAALPILLNALRSYAMDHSNRFPDIGGDPYRSLQALYPGYISPDYLAGISGDHKGTKRQILGGGHLNSNISSLVYVPGLSLTNDPQTAILWERRTGVAFNGRRSPGRPVGFISGEVKQIPDTEWRIFLSNQAALRRE